MKRGLVSLALIAGTLFVAQRAQAGPIRDFLARPSTQGVVLTQQYQGRTYARYTYPGYAPGNASSVERMPGWIRFGYPTNDYPTSRNYGGPGYTGLGF